jgi:hypothetical protein
MFRKCSVIAFVLIILTGCTTVETPIPEMPITPAATSEPLSTATVAVINPESNITIVGVVMDVSLSARIIMLKDPVEGIHVLALNQNCELTSSIGEKIELHDIQPGITVRASGQLDESNALLTSFVLVQ